jgi:hypothetical protein
MNFCVSCAICCISTYVSYNNGVTFFPFNHCIQIAHRREKYGGKKLTVLYLNQFCVLAMNFMLILCILLMYYGIICTVFLSYLIMHRCYVYCA